jgi:hypothetical protein
MPNDNINIHFKDKKEKNNNIYNNLLQGSPKLLQGNEYFPRRPSSNSRYYDAMGANQYASVTPDNSSHGR